MLHVTEHTPQRLVLQARSYTMLAVMLVFTIFSASLPFLWLAAKPGPFLSWQWGGFQTVSLVLWMGIALVFVLMGVSLCVTLAQGTRLVFDRTGAEVSLCRAKGFRAHCQTYSFYAVRTVMHQHNAEIKVHGLYLVMKSGERVVLGTLPEYETEAVETIERTVRQFLYQPI